MSNYYLCHHGIKGMKWGVRRYQNKDGSYTAAGKKRRQSYEDRVRQKMKDYDKANPQRSRKDNYTIALRKEGRAEGDRLAKATLVSMGVAAVGTILAPNPVGVAAFASGAVSMIGRGYVSGKRQQTLDDISDEYNIERSRRVLNQ